MEEYQHVAASKSVNGDTAFYVHAIPKYCFTNSRRLGKASAVVSGQMRSRDLISEPRFTNLGATFAPPV